jgi:hypothetical protein
MALTILPEGTPDTVLVGTSDAFPGPIFFDDNAVGQGEASNWMGGPRADGAPRRLFRCKLHPEAELFHVPPADGPSLRERDQ